MKSYGEWLSEKYSERFIYIKSSCRNKQERFSTYVYGGATFYSFKIYQRSINLPHVFIKKAIRLFQADDINSFLVYNTKENRFRKIWRPQNTSLDDFIEWLDDCSWKSIWDIIT